MELVMKGHAWKFGDNLDVDEHIAPHCGIYYYLQSQGYRKATESWYTEPQKLIKHCMAGVDPEFSKKVKKGDIMIVGRNFGCGHGHVTGAFAIKYTGVGVVAESIYRQFLRNAVDIGLPMLVCEDITKRARQGDELEVNFSTGRIKNLTTSQTIRTNPLPEPLLQIIEAGGLISFLKKKLKAT